MHIILGIYTVHFIEILANNPKQAFCVFLLLQRMLKEGKMQQRSESETMYRQLIGMIIVMKESYCISFISILTGEMCHQNE